MFECITVNWKIFELKIFHKEKFHVKKFIVIQLARKIFNVLAEG